jgi:hypothetical protein
MPRGVPKAGVRNARNARSVKPQIVARPVVIETDDQIEAKLNTRFGVLGRMAEGCTTGAIRSMVVSGPAGLGKSFVIEKTLQEWDPSESDWTIIKGYIRPTGLFKLLYQYREKGQVLVFDDADAVFSDETSLNLLKAACDSSERRRISYMTEGRLFDEDSAMMLPKSFDFEGTIIFITNYDFDAMIEKGHKLAPHFSALVSRSLYIDLAMKTRRDYMVRIRQVVRDGLLEGMGLAQSEREEVLAFIEANVERMRELSLRMALKVGSVRKLGSNWKDIATVTCLKTAA